MGNNTIHKEERIREEQRKSVGLRHSGRCHGSSHAVSHTHTVSSLCMLFRPTQSHTLQYHSHSVCNQTAQAIRKHTALLDCLKNEVFFYTECFSDLFDERMSYELLQYAGAQIFLQQSVLVLESGLCISHGNFGWLNFFIIRWQKTATVFMSGHWIISWSNLFKYTAWFRNATRLCEPLNCLLKQFVQKH